MAEPRHISEILPKVLGSIGAYKQRGAEAWGPCPFHDDIHPSFSVNTDTGAWYCFTCAEGGSIYQLAKRLGIKNDYKPSLRGSSGKPKKRKVEPWQRAKRIEEASDMVEDQYLEDYRKEQNQLVMELNENRIEESDFYFKRQILDYQFDNRMAIHDDLRNRLTYEAIHGN